MSPKKEVEKQKKSDDLKGKTEEQIKTEQFARLENKAEVYARTISQLCETSAKVFELWLSTHEDVSAEEKHKPLSPYWDFFQDGVEFGERQYEKKIEELENQIADIKANCDLAIEGRDIKIMELEKEVERLKKQNFIYYNEREYNNKVQKQLHEQIEKMKADVKQGQSYWNSGEMQYDLYQRLLDKWEIKEK